MRIELRDQPFAPLAELADYQARLDERLPGQYGATAIFIGTMRDFNDGDPVQRMTLEHYPGMTERQLQRIVETAVSALAVAGHSGDSSGGRFAAE